MNILVHDKRMYYFPISENAKKNRKNKKDGFFIMRYVMISNLFVVKMAWAV